MEVVIILVPLFETEMDQKPKRASRLLFRVYQRLVCVINEQSNNWFELQKWKEIDF